MGSSYSIWIRIQNLFPVEIPLTGSYGYNTHIILHKMSAFQSAQFLLTDNHQNDIYKNWRNECPNNFDKLVYLFSPKNTFADHKNNKTILKRKIQWLTVSKTNLAGNEPDESSIKWFYIGGHSPGTSLKMLLFSSCLSTQLMTMIFLVGWMKNCR